MKLQFPTHLRKMWSGTEVQEWLDRQLSDSIFLSESCAERGCACFDDRVDGKPVEAFIVEQGK